MTILPRLIAHRGNLSGPCPEAENKPDYILNALSKGYDAEIDVWINSDDEIYLGHDAPQYKITLDFLLDNKSKLWCHAKNLEALDYLMFLGVHVFSHHTDNFVLTSEKVVWFYPGKGYTMKSKCVQVLPEWNLEKLNLNAYAICSDYCTSIRLSMESEEKEMEWLKNKESHCTVEFSNLNKMFRGWLIGDFTPSILQTKQFEIGILSHMKNEQWPKHYHNYMDEYNVLIKGTMMVNDIQVNCWDIFTVKKTVACKCIFLEDCTILCIKTPSVPGDKILI